MAQKIHFTKMQGAGNDYIYVDATRFAVKNPSKKAVVWSDRHKGIGSDGLVLIGLPTPQFFDHAPTTEVPEADFAMRIFNADGSEAMMCGNACRCIGKYLFERGLTTKTTIRLLTLSGVRMLSLHVDGDMVKSVTVDMQQPVLQDKSLFVAAPGLCKGTFVSMGNPHYVVFTDDVNEVETKGMLLERHPSFPHRCNIEFAHVIRQSGSYGDVIRTRVWERGSGITLACGTGACATAVAACCAGKAGRRSSIVMDGGTLDIEWRESDNHVYLNGPAEFVYDGEIDLGD